MAGKDKISKGINIYVDDVGTTARNLSGDLIPDSLTGGGLTIEPADMTGQNHAVHNSLANLATAELSMQFHMNDTLATGAYTVLQGICGGAAGTVTLQWGIAGATPTSSDPEWEGEYILTQMNGAINNGALVLDCVFMPGSSTAPAWGTVA